MLAETVMPSIKNHEDYSDQGNIFISLVPNGFRFVETINDSWSVVLGLALFVSKDGEAVIGGNTLRSSGSFERVHIADAGVT